MLFKTNNFYINPIIFLFILVSLSNCKSKATENEISGADTIKVDNVVMANDWNELFIKNEGWFGGDGIFAIPLDGREFVPATEETETLLLFSDTMVGESFQDSLTEGKYHMINNSVALLKGNKPDPDKITFHYNEQTNEKSGAIFVPDVPGVSPNEYYWLGDGFVNVDADSTLYIFAYRITNIEKVEGALFNFKQLGLCLISIPQGSKPPFKDHKQVIFPFYNLSDTTEPPISFGSAIYVNTRSAGAPNPDGYVYVYGTKGGDKELMVARVKPEDFSEFEKWGFWNGARWTNNIDSTAAIAKHVSNEMSISPLPNGQLLMTYHHRSIEPEVAIQVGDSPVGPFGTMQKIWYTEEVKEDDDFFTYNSKAHPHLSPHGSVLISYNVNSFDFWNDIINKPHLYRPRFIVVSF